MSNITESELTNTLDNLFIEFCELTKIGFVYFTKSVLASDQVWNSIDPKLSAIDYRNHFLFNCILLLHSPHFHIHQPINYKFERNDYLLNSNQYIYFEDLVKLAQEFPKSVQDAPHYSYILAQFLNKYKLYEKSLKCFELSEDYYKNKPAASFYVDWGETLFKVGDFKEGNNKYEFACNLAPNKWWIYNSWADILQDHFFKKESLEKDEIGLKLKPEYGDFYLNIAKRCSIHHNVFEDKMEILSNMGVENGYPDKLTFYKEIGIWLYNQSYYEKAKQIFIKTIKLNDISVELKSWYAKCLYNTLEYELAFKEFVKAFLLSPYFNFDQQYYNLWDNTIKMLGRKIRFDEVSKINDSISKDFRQSLDVLDLVERLLSDLNENDKIDKDSRSKVWNHFRRYFETDKEDEYVNLSMDATWLKNANPQLIPIKHDLKTKLSLIESSTGLTYPTLATILNKPLYQVEPETDSKNIYALQQKVLHDSDIPEFSLILQPKHKSSNTHQNEIILVNSIKKTKLERNNPFDFLYYLIWLNKEGNPGIKSRKLDEKIPPSMNIIPNSHINRIFPINNQYGRFAVHWAWVKGNESQIRKMISDLNIDLRGELGINLELIIKKNEYYTINKDISVELKPYPK